MKIIALILFLVTSCSAQITFGNHGEGRDVSGTTVASIATASFTVNTGSVVYCVVRQGTSNTVPTSVTDAGSNTYTHTAGADATVDATDLLSSWSAKITTGFTGTVTANFNGNQSFVAILCREYRPSTSFSSTPVDQALTATDNSGLITTLTSNTFTTTSANEVIVVCATAGSTAITFSAGSIGGTTASNLIADAAAGSEMAGCEDRIVTSTQTSITGGIVFGATTFSMELSGLTIAQSAVAPATGSTIVGPSTLQAGNKVL